MDQFEVGDVVVHPAHGVGYIVKIEEKQVPEKGTRLCYKVNMSKGTVWIPVETRGGTPLRLVTAKSDLDQYRRVLKSPPIFLDKNHHHRHLKLVSRLKQGSFQGLCEVVRDLTAWGRRKPLGPADTAMLQKTRENLYQEWATAAGISPAEASKEVQALLRTT